MTDKIQQARRAAFEEWWKSSGLSKFPETAWMAFNGALDCILIELPEPEEFDGYYNGGFAIREEGVRAAIESTNLGIKVK